MKCKATKNYLDVVFSPLWRSLMTWIKFSGAHSFLWKWQNIAPHNLNNIKWFVIKIRCRNNSYISFRFKIVFGLGNPHTKIHQCLVGVEWRMSMLIWTVIPFLHPVLERLGCMKNPHHQLYNIEYLNYVQNYLKE